jgi:hypothetical protein
VTLLFVLVDIWERRRRWWRLPHQVRAIPRWQSVSGLAVWTVFTLWLLAAPIFPYLLFGPAADSLKLAPGWLGFYSTILLLLLAGIAQRAINLVHPDWTWLMPAARVATNGIGFVILFVYRNSHLVAVADQAKDLAHYERLAEIFNASVLRGLVGYLLINAVIHACVCVPLVSRWIRGNRNPALARA